MTVIGCNDAAQGAEHVQLCEVQMDPGRATFTLPDVVGGAGATGRAAMTVRGADDPPEARVARRTAARALVMDVRLNPMPSGACTPERRARP